MLLLVCVALRWCELAGHCRGMEELACESPAAEAVEALDNTGLEDAGASGPYGGHGDVVGRGSAGTEGTEGGIVLEVSGMPLSFQALV